MKGCEGLDFSWELAISNSGSSVSIASSSSRSNMVLLKFVLIVDDKLRLMGELMKVESVILMREVVKK